MPHIVNIDEEKTAQVMCHVLVTAQDLLSTWLGKSSAVVPEGAQKLWASERRLLAGWADTGNGLSMKSL